ncbi:hypothetical protein BFG51_14115 [Dietzia alimentaria]|nr:hypothetical protein BFG51_14115 [Dietzia alimentaria]
MRLRGRGEHHVAAGVDHRFAPGRTTARRGGPRIRHGHDHPVDDVHVDHPAALQPGPRDPVYVPRRDSLGPGSALCIALCRSSWFHRSPPLPTRAFPADPPTRPLSAARAF